MSNIKKIIFAFALPLLICVSALADGVFLLPDVNSIDDEALAFSAVEDGIFIPESVSYVSASVFGEYKPTVYGFKDSAAQTAADTAGCVFCAVDIENIQLAQDGVCFAGDTLCITVNAQCELPLEYSLVLLKDNAVVAEYDYQTDNEFEFVPDESGEFDARIYIENEFTKAECYKTASITVSEPIKLKKNRFTVTDLGTSVCPIATDEARQCHLEYANENTDRIELDGNCFKGLTEGEYILNAVCGDIVTPLTVTVVKSPASIDISLNSLSLCKNTYAAAKVIFEDTAFDDVIWNCGENAQIDENGVIYGVNAGECVIAASCGSASAQKTITVTQSVEQIVIDDSDIPEVFTEGMNAKLYASVYPSDAYNKQIIWASSDESVVTVGKYSGTVNAIGTGSAQISCTASDSAGAKVEITVTVQTGVSTVTINGIPDTMLKGESYTAQITTQPQDALEAEAVLTSSDTSVLCVDGTTVTALKNGTAVLTAKCINGATAQVTVTVPILDNLAELLIDTVYLNKNMSLNINELIAFNPLNVSSKTALWTGENDYISVDEGGIVTAKTVGSAVLTGVTPGGSSLSANVVCVKDSVPTSISISREYGILSVGSGGMLKATFKSGIAEKYKTCAWISDDPSVVKIDGSAVGQSVKIHAVAPGVARIYAIASSGVKAVCTKT